jgi:uncharacterized protein (DUF3084 family)
MSADSRIRPNVEHAEDLLAEISYLKKKLSDVQQLLAELHIENEQVRQSPRRRSD